MTSSHTWLIIPVGIFQILVPFKGPFLSCTAKTWSNAATSSYLTMYTLHTHLGQQLNPPIGLNSLPPTVQLKTLHRKYNMEGKISKRRCGISRTRKCQSTFKVDELMTDGSHLLFVIENKCPNPNLVWCICREGGGSVWKPQWEHHICRLCMVVAETCLHYIHILIAT